VAQHNKDGQVAEQTTEEFLIKQGYKILDRNWKTRFCEIDIVAQKDGVIHFVEVKFRGSSTAGEGFEYITSTKLRQMGFAADLWVAKHKYEGEYVLSAAQVNRQLQVEYLKEITT
jgi:ribonuclease HII